MRKSCSLRERAAGMHGKLPCDGSGARSELMGQGMQVK